MRARGPRLRVTGPRVGPGRVRGTCRTGPSVPVLEELAVPWVLCPYRRTWKWESHRFVSSLFTEGAVGLHTGTRMFSEDA